MGKFAIRQQQSIGRRTPAFYKSLYQRIRILIDIQGSSHRLIYASSRKFGRTTTQNIFSPLPVVRGILKQPMKRNRRMLQPPLGRNIFPQHSVDLWRLVPCMTRTSQNVSTRGCPKSLIHTATSTIPIKRLPRRARTFEWRRMCNQNGTFILFMIMNAKVKVGMFPLSKKKSP
ncbi:hypothetical protein LIER_06813 [Lithospermum erythrorhizon]|uniref:Uncharacterized protein n=1 Tax=Lithospermum erythrorhizon TaxID=34254 RepID=A0AAV3P8G8_LITER